MSVPAIYQVDPWLPMLLTQGPIFGQTATAKAEGTLPPFGTGGYFPKPNDGPAWYDIQGQIQASATNALADALKPIAETMSEIATAAKDTISQLGVYAILVAILAIGIYGLVNRE